MLGEDHNWSRAGRITLLLLWLKKSCFFLHHNKFLPTSHHFRKRLFYSFRNDFEISLQNIFGTYFPEYILLISNLPIRKQKECVSERIFWNNLLSFGFPNPKTPLAYRTSILKTFLLREPDSGITQNCKRIFSIFQRI